MSGIVGIVNLDGKPVDRQLLERMTGTMSRHGPDATGVWCSGHVGFGHAMLRVSAESEHEQQPHTLDGDIWITADARIDGRQDLLGRLRSAGQTVQANAPDCELILHAYRAFGERFLNHLIGDFAFAIWDSANQQLVCARDHFGVRPFFYAKTDSVFVFGSELDVVLEHASVSTRLDELAIGDFLLFGANQEPERSIYHDIRRLPAASEIHLTRDAFRVSRYWDVPQPNEGHYRDYSECVERFKEVFAQAVNDRAQTPNVAVELSGGMDSTSIAAILAADKQTTDRAVTAYTMSCERLLPEDREAQFAGMVASHLGIPLVEQASYTYALFERFDQPEFVTGEPAAYPLLAARYDTFSQIAASGARVLLTGQGGDGVFGGSSPGPRDSGRSVHALRRLAGICRHVRHTGTLRGLGLRSALLTALGRSPPWHPDFPDWIDADFARRTDLHDRWRLGWKIIDGAVGIQRQLGIPWLSSIFDDYEVLRLPLVVRHPFFDVRLVDFLVHLPNHVTSGKKILRDAMRGKLPDDIRLRPKTYLQGDDVRARFTTGKISVPSERRLALVEGKYVDADRYQRAFASYLDGEGSKSTWTSYYMISPIALNNWLTLRTIDETHGVSNHERARTTSGAFAR
ncbi:MAG: asparagine synthase-related protein [Dokdonella sp.]